MKSRRFIAYLIDVILVLIICSIIYNFIPNTEVNSLNMSLNEYTERVLNKDISIYEYFANYVRINYSIDKISIAYTGINILLTLIYFVIVPILSKGSTIGLKLFSLKISGELNFKNMLIRNAFATGILYMTLNVILIHLFDYKIYFILITILSLIQILLVILSLSMIIYRKDEKGLQDVFSDTHIEKVI